MLHGRVENNSVLLKDVTIEVVKDNEIVDEFINNKNGSYKYRFALGSIYNISFTKEGYITKTVGVIAQTPDSLITGNFFFQLDIDLFQMKEGIEEEPVFPAIANILIKDQKDGFIYDKRYVRWASEEYELLKME